MGFYNYYRLLKEIRFLLRNKKVKKFLTIIIIVIIVISILHTKGYCADELDYTDFNYSSYIEPIDTTNFHLTFNPTTSEFELNEGVTRYGYLFSVRDGFSYMYNLGSSTNFSYVFCNEVPVPGTKGYGYTNMTSSSFYLSLQRFNGYIYIYSSSVLNSGTLTEMSTRNFTFQDNNHYLTLYDFIIGTNGVIEGLNEITASIRDLQNTLQGSVQDYSTTSTALDGNIGSNKQIYASNYDKTFIYELPDNEHLHIDIEYTSPSSYSGLKTFRYGFTNTLPAVNDYIDTVSGSVAFNGEYNVTKKASVINRNKYKYFVISCANGFNLSTKMAIDYGGFDSVEQNITEQGNQTRETITNSNININSDQLVTDNTQDITDTGFDNIFEMIRTAFTGTPQAITFPIPFLNTSFTLQPNFLSDMLTTGGLSFFVTLVNAYWYFVVARFIVKKIHSIIEGLKEGEFEQTTGNIKTEVF